MPREERDRRVAGGVERVQSVGDHLGQRRLRGAPGLQRPRHDRGNLARAPQQIGDDVLGHHELHLVGHARHRVHDLVADRAAQARRGADRVRDRVPALGDVGLAEVVLGHVAQARAEHGRDVLGEVHPANERHAHELGDRVAREVVLGRTEPAADEHRVAPAQEVAERVDDARLVVADDPMLVGVDPRRRELLADPGAVAVDDLPQQQLGADREYLTSHVVAPSVRRGRCSLLAIRWQKVWSRARFCHQSVGGEEATA